MRATEFGVAGFGPRIPEPAGFPVVEWRGYSLSMNSAGFEGSGERPFLFLISVTSG